MNWDWITLGDVLTVTPALITLVEHELYKQIVLKPYPRGVVLKTLKRGLDFPRKQQKLACKGQFIISRLHVSRKFWGIVPPDLDNAIISQKHLIFDIHPDLEPNYFAAYLSTPLFRQAAFLACSPQGWLVFRQLMKIVVPLPSVEEQRRISEVWVYANKVMQETAEMYASITHMKTGLMDTLFQNADSGWEQRRLGDYAHIGDDRSVKYAVSLLPPNQLALGADLVPEGGVGILPNGELDSQFLYYYLESQKPKLQLTTSQGDLAQALRNFPFRLPTLYQQRKRAGVIQNHNKSLFRIRAEQIALQKLIQGIMHQIFTGKLNVPEVLPMLRELPRP